MAQISQRTMSHVAFMIAEEALNARRIIPLNDATTAERRGRLAALGNLAEAMAMYFAYARPICTPNGNRRFDRAEFLKACMIEED